MIAFVVIQSCGRLPLHIDHRKTHAVKWMRKFRRTHPTYVDLSVIPVQLTLTSAVIAESRVTKRAARMALADARQRQELL